MNSMIDNESDRLVEAYPHIEEKAIVDFINGLSVMSDHFSEKSKIANGKPSARLIDKLIGQDIKRQGLLDRSVEDSLIFLKDYVVSNEERLANNEYFLADVMSGVGLVSGKLQEVAGDTFILRENLSELANNVDRMEQTLSKRMDDFDLYNSAMAEMRLGVSIFAQKDKLFSPEQSLWMLLTRLKYGDFGRWLEKSGGNSKHEKNIQTVLKTLKNDCLRILSEQTGRSAHDLVDRESLFGLLSSENELQKDALCLVSSHNSNALEPIILSMNGGGVHEHDDDLPFVFSNASIYEEMERLFEQRGSYAAIH